MARIPGLRRLMRVDRGRGAVDRAVDDELRFHFDETVRELVAQGRSVEDARGEATRRFGNVQRTREQLASIDRARVGQERLAEWFGAFAQDVRYTLRGLRRTPGFAAGVIVTLGLGIGANTTMVGVVDRLLYQPPAYLALPGRVHRLYFAMQQPQGKEYAAGTMQYQRYRDVVNWSRTLDQVVAYDAETSVVGLGEDASSQLVGAASANLWTVFATRPALGRFFTAHEDVPPTGTHVAVLSYQFWQSRYGGRAGALDSTLMIGSNRYSIVGVAPERFAGFSLEAPAVFLPITAWSSDQYGTLTGNNGTAWYRTYSITYLELYARTKPGVTDAAATADLTEVIRRSQAARVAEQPSAISVAVAKPRAIVMPVQAERGPNPDPASKVALWLVGVAAIVLLIACANVANLLLARAISRRRETAVRIALGVSRRRLLRQVLTESCLLALAGGAVAVLFAQWGAGILRATLTKNISWAGPLYDGRVLALTGAIALLTGIVAGVVPALQSTGADVADALKAGAREGTTRRSRARTALVLTQCALSVTLLVGAGLFVRSLRNVEHVHLGFDADHLLWVQLQMRGVALDSTRSVALRDELVAQALRTAGVTHAARNVSVPFRSEWDRPLFVAGIDSVSKLGDFELQAVSPGFFPTMGTRLLRGRAIDVADRADAPRAMVVSQSMATRLWPAREAIGQCVRLDADTLPCYTVVGVAEDIKDGDFGDAPAYHYYLSDQQFAPTSGGLFVRTNGPAEKNLEQVRRSLQRVMPGVAYARITAMSEVLGSQLDAWRIGATMFTVFGALALLVASVGLYSVIAYGVARRTHEIGVRIALGAPSGALIAQVVREGVAISVAGIAIGAAIAVGAGHWLEPVLFHESARDPLVLGGVAAALLVVAAMASWIPARRATRVDPIQALRAERLSSRERELSRSARHGRRR